MAKKSQNDLKQHVLTQKRLKITFFRLKKAPNDRVYPKIRNLKKNHPLRAYEKKVQKETERKSNNTQFGST